MNAYVFPGVKKKFFIVQEITEKEFKELLKKYDRKSDIDHVFISEEQYPITLKKTLIATKKSKVNFITGINE